MPPCNILYIQATKLIKNSCANMQQMTNFMSWFHLFGKFMFKNMGCLAGMGQQEWTISHSHASDKFSTIVSGYMTRCWKKMTLYGIWRTNCVVKNIHCGGKKQKRSLLSHENDNFTSSYNVVHFCQELVHSLVMSPANIFA